MKILLRFLRPAIKAFMGLFALAIPPLFPDALKYEPGHPIAHILIAFGLILFVLAGWEIVESSRKQVVEKSPLQQPAFIAEYSKSCTAAIQMAQDIPGYTEAECNEAVTAVLKILHTLVASYAEEGNKARLNLNVMRPFLFSRERALRLGKSLHFYDPNVKDDVYSYILELTHWANANHCVPDNFALPVHKANRELLFGAPAAFILGQTQVVGDIKNKKTAEELSQDQYHTIKGDIRKYLDERNSFRCFISIQLTFHGKDVGVLNMQTTKQKAFGDRNNPTPEMRDFVLPLCKPLFLVLGMILAELETKTLPARQVSKLASAPLSDDAPLPKFLS